MNCPVCPNTQLVMADRNGVEIDYCPSCRGVWLDRGELDKILERSGREEQAAYSGYRQNDSNYRRDDYRDQRSGPIPQPGPPPENNLYWDGYRWKRKKGWLEEIFD